jgi:hypothetical protein
MQPQWQPHVTDTKMKREQQKITDAKTQPKRCKNLIHPCDEMNLPKVHLVSADPGGRAVSGLGLWLLACWDCGFESRLGHGCLSPVNVACFYVEISATDRSLAQRSPIECGVSECRLEASVVRRPWLIRGCCTMGKTLLSMLEFQTNILCFVRHMCIHLRPPEEYFSLNERLLENV